MDKSISALLKGARFSPACGGTVPTELAGYFYTGQSHHRGHTQKTRTSQGGGASGGGGVCHGHDVVGTEVDGGFARELERSTFPEDQRLYRNLVARESARLREDELSIEMASRMYEFDLHRCRTDTCNTLLHPESSFSFCKRCRNQRIEDLRRRSAKRRTGERKRAAARNVEKVILESLDRFVVEGDFIGK